MSSWTLGSPPPRAMGRHSPSRTILSSMPRRMGSAMPKVRRRDSMRTASWVASQDLRRASRGCVETGLLAAASKGERPTPWRRVSWMPGAEGAEEVWSVWEKVEGPLAAGTIRRDCAIRGRLS
ncbi:hypothetical protein CCMA1212_004549 [Trichoderma ghanense]|uniref:Uncharacterized protein n=1 Tax=Trichoderma ghanense TaxID=65468 RepID=A0ABY2H6P5_9HYPO